MAKILQYRIFEPPEILQERGGDDYANFCAKFEPKKTTDDCYTPPNVYETVKNFVVEKLLNDGKKYQILRPFYPTKDYLTENYTPDTVVIDNPPFSLYSKIVRNYLAMGVKFFLFAPALTQFVVNAENVCYIITAANIIYKNGARVRTNFTTNLLPDYRVWICPELLQRIKAAQNERKKEQTAANLPQNVYSSARLLKYVNRTDSDVFVKATETDGYIRKTGNYKIYGAALKINSEKLTSLN